MIMKTVAGTFLCALVAMCASAQTYTLTFDDLPRGANLTGTYYRGIFWEQGNGGYHGNLGGWGVPTAASYPYSAPNDLINLWGSTLTGMRFPSAVNVQGAYFSVQGDGTNNWTTGIRVHGYLNGAEVALTDWLLVPTPTPTWVPINLNDVDRIVIESQPRSDGGGWFGMDNLTYQIVPEPGGVSLLSLALVCLVTRRTFALRKSVTNHSVAL